MNKKTIKKLAQSSYSKNTLDSGKITKITKNLKRSDLKVYIKNLKDLEAQKKVVVTVPSEDGMREIKAHFSKLYPDKKLVFNLDPTLLSGVKVVDYDNVYELSVKSFLENSIRTTND